MSSFAGYCSWCGKPVMHKTLFGTLHLCLTTEEKAQVVMMRQQQPNKQWQQFLREHPELTKSIKEPIGD